MPSAVIRRLSFLLGLAVAGLLAACATPAPQIANPQITSTAVADIKVTGDVGKPPTVTLPGMIRLQTSSHAVLTPGPGAAIKDGQRVTLWYHSINGTTGTTIDEIRQVTLLMSAPPSPPGVVKQLIGVPVGSRVVMGLAPGDHAGLEGLYSAGVAEGDTLVIMVDVVSARDVYSEATGKSVAARSGIPSVSVKSDGKPTISVTGSPASKLTTQAIIVGPGVKSASGSTLTVKICGRTWSGKTVDCDWKTPRSLVLGTGRYLSGVENGLAGQTSGSRVVLVIPPDDGYGAAGNAKLGVRGIDTLVYVIDILDVQG